MMGSITLAVLVGMTVAVAVVAIIDDFGDWLVEDLTKRRVE